MNRLTHWLLSSALIFAVGGCNWFGGPIPDGRQAEIAAALDEAQDELTEEINSDQSDMEGHSDVRSDRVHHEVNLWWNDKSDFASLTLEREYRGGEWSNVYFPTVSGPRGEALKARIVAKLKARGIPVENGR